MWRRGVTALSSLEGGRAGREGEKRGRREGGRREGGRVREGEGRGRKEGGEIYYSIIIYRSQEAENVRTPQIPGKTGNE